MGKKATAIHRSVLQAVDRGTALTGKEIYQFRTRSTEAITSYKIAFWVAIGIFNLIIWVPMPIDRSILIAFGVLTVAFAFIAPIMGIRNHQKRLDLLRDAPSAPKKKGANEAGRRYMEQVRSEGRPFVKAEVEILERTGIAGEPGRA